MAAGEERPASGPSLGAAKELPSAAPQQAFQSSALCFQRMVKKNEEMTARYFIEQLVEEDVAT
jgi:hypothetical protein